MALTRVTLVAGFLGAGKTSVIRHLLTQAEFDGDVAVLVNEIGAAGIDGDVIKQASSADNARPKQCHIREMAGGCICCSANLPFRQALVELLRRQPDCLIVEPTGVAAVDKIREVFADPGIAPFVSLEPVLVVVDPRQWDVPRIRQHPLYQEQCASADVMAMSHLDQCDDDLIARFSQAHSHIPLVTADHGQLTQGWRQLATTCPEPNDNAVHSAVHSKGISQHTITWPQSQVISLAAIRDIWQKQPVPSAVLRCKGIIRTDAGWVNLQINDQDITTSPTAPGEQSRLVVIMLAAEEIQPWWQAVKIDFDRLAVG